VVPLVNHRQEIVLFRPCVRSELCSDHVFVPSAPSRPGPELGMNHQLLFELGNVSIGKFLLACSCMFCESFCCSYCRSFWEPPSPQPPIMLAWCCGQPSFVLCMDLKCSACFAPARVFICWVASWEGVGVAKLQC